MAELAALVSPGQFKAKKKDPEKMLGDFKDYIKAVRDMMVVMGKDGATAGVKKAILRSVGGKDMVSLFDHVGKVTDGDTFDQAVTKIEEAIKAQTNKAMAKYKLFMGLPQEGEAFSTWWTQIQEQADKCDFTGYDVKMAARDAILFQTSNNKLRKRVLAEDCNLEAVIKLGLAMEHSESKAGMLGKAGSKKESDSEVRRLQDLEEEVSRLKLEQKAGKKGQVCQTCPRGQHPEGRCPGKKASECYSCRKAGHFKGAPICKGKPKEDSKSKGQGKLEKVKKVKQEEQEETDSDEDTSDGESTCRVREMVAVVRDNMQDPMVKVELRPRKQFGQVSITWLADSGVRRSLLSEKDWVKLTKVNTQLRLKKNKVRFTPYGTTKTLPVMGRAKVVMRNEKGKLRKTMVYVVEGQTESLLGKLDAEALGILQIVPEGTAQGDKVRRITPVTRESINLTGVVSGNQTQDQIDKKMERLVREYKVLFKGIGKAKIAPIHIFTKKGREPVAQRQRPVARHYMEPLKKHLKELLDGDVIEGPLGSEHATGWVSNVVITGKAWDKDRIRMNLDTRLMANNVRQTHFPIPTCEQLRHEFQGSDRFSALDMNHAFHQLEIDEESRKLFVFTTPFGLFRYKRLVMGTPPASSECHDKIKRLLGGLAGVVQIKDDLVVHGKGPEHDERLKQVFERFKQAGLTLRKEKCKLGKQEVVWFGHVFSRQGMSPDPEKVKTIKAWPVPKDKSEVKSFLQTCQFCSRYMRGAKGETYSDVTKPLRELTRQGVWFKWTEECEQSFHRLKEMLISDTVLVAYDTKRVTRLYVDHGPDGLASTVGQRYDVAGERKPQWRPVTHSSRTLTEAEKGYGKTEGESLAILSGIMTHKEYLYGTVFEVVTDHKPLVSLYNSPNRPAPVRVDRHRGKLRNFRFKVVYEPGNTSPADYGSRHPNPPREYTETEREELGVEDMEEDEECTVNCLEEDTAVTMGEIRQAVQEDTILRQVVEDIKKGYMSQGTKQSEYAKVFEEFTHKDGLLLKGRQLVIPPRLQMRVIEAAHEGHMKERKTIGTLRERNWFPRLSKMTKEFVESCLGCAAGDTANPPAPLVSRSMPGKPWEEVAVDFKGPIGGSKGYYFHVVIDTYSRYPEVQIVKSTEFSRLTKALAPVWSTHGIPEMVRHDGGPPYNGKEWRKYAKQMGFETDKTPPYHPQANGLVEKFNKSIVKMIHGAIAENKDPKKEVHKFLTNYRNTPHDTTGKCPSQLLMNRTIRTKVPVFIPKPTGKADKEARQADKKQKEKQKNYADKKRRARYVEYKVGDRVLLKQTKTTTKPPYDPKAYIVEEVTGTVVTAKRGEKIVTRNVQRWKKIKERQAPTKQQVKETRRQEDSDEEDDDWEFDLTTPQPREQEQEEQAEAGEGPGQPEDQRHPQQAQRQIPKERWMVAEGPWRPKNNSPSPRERKRKQQEARKRDKGQQNHPYQLRKRREQEEEEEEE